MAAGGIVEIEVIPDTSKFPGKLQSGLQSSSGIASAFGKGLGLAISAGTVAAAAGFAQVIKLGNEYQGKLNEIQAVSGATGDTMAKVGQRAKELGSDVQLSGVSASDAAGAMLELAKGGLTVDQAMQAAKGTLQLAGAAQIEGARAAEIQSQTLNQFALSAGEAGRVADVLANTANAAAGSVDDIALAMKYVGPVAASMKISLEDTASAVGILANNGIKADSAGTALRGMLVSLAAPSKPARAALQELGITAFDSSGKFVGFRSVIDQLSDAQGRMSDQSFQAAAATAFGREPLAAIVALARSGTPAFDSMSTAVGRQGGAAEVAAAKMKGLGGAMEGFKSNVETAAISVYEIVDGPLEGLVRSATKGLDLLNDGLSGKLDTSKLAGLNAVVSTGKDLWSQFTGILRTAADAAKPVAEGVSDVVQTLDRGDSVLAAFSGGMSLVGDTASGTANVLKPVGSVLGGLLSTFASLPGPIQTAALALAVMKSGLISLPTPQAVSGLRSFNDEARIQRQLAAASGESISRWASYQTAFNTSTNAGVTGLRNFRDQVTAVREGAAGAGQPISTLTAGIRTLAERSGTLGAMASSFTSVSGAVRDAGTRAEESGSKFGGAVGKVSGFAGALAGIGASAGTGVLRGLGGLVSFLGGPWGIAIGAASVALSLLGQRQADAARSAQEHQQRVSDLAGTLDKLTGSATAATREMTAQSLTQTKLKDGTTTLGAALTRAGISATDYVDATTGNQGKLDQLNATLFTQARATLESSSAWANNKGELQAAGVTLDLATAAALGNVQAQEQMQAKLDAQGKGWDGLSDKVRNAIGPLGEIGSLLGAQAGQYAEAAKATKDSAAAAQNFNDVLKTLADNKGFEVMKNGGPITEPLRAGLDALSQSASRMATEAGKTSAGLYGLDAGAAKARESMQASRDSFVQAAEGALGSKEAAEALATSIGLVPSAAETIFRTNATGVAAEMITLQAQINSVPAGKDVTVKALTDDARARLEEMGFKVTNLPNGQFLITANTDPARAKLDAEVAHANSSVGTITIDGKADPATGKINQTVKLADGSTGTITVEANPNPATGKIQGTVRLADGSTGTITIDGNQTPANGKVNAVITYADGRTAIIPVDARTAAANSAIDNAARTRTATIRVVVQESSDPRVRAVRQAHGGAIGGIVHAMNDGGVVGMASGGRVGVKLRPMRGGIAQVVGPNTWRVIGDRVKDDEAYIPINRSARSRRIFEETARRMGYTAVRQFATGGIASQIRNSVASSVAARSHVAGVSTDPEVVALLRSIAQTNSRDVIVNQHVVNPVAEKASDTLTRNLRTLSQMGAF